ncbi:MAG: CofH family radical SAM protein [Bacteroidetes bacterium]|nr:CofH family radical SAM protein [Bacteroidota bacterium]
MLEAILASQVIPEAQKSIACKIFEGKRISSEEGILLYYEGSLSLLALLADHVRRSINGKLTYYNRNVHIEPTNICVYNCRFCSYSNHQSPESWELTIDEMVDKVESLGNEITEVHIVGAVHPGRDIHYYAGLIQRVREARPGIHIKAFTAIEIEYMVKKAGLSLEEGLMILKEAGLDSIPGGGAEIFDEKIREVICGQKSTSEAWLEVHEVAHNLGIPSNATILYGHIEKYEHRIEHLNRLRELQDKTHGFNAFIPLKFRNKNNELSWIEEVSLIEDMRNYAMSRIFLDNIPHIKAYWPMIGKQMAALSLSFGVDDLDGTINDSTKIYSLAGADDQNPALTSDAIRELITGAGLIPVERDSVYNILDKQI